MIRLLKWLTAPPPIPCERPACGHDQFAHGPGWAECHAPGCTCEKHQLTEQPFSVFARELVVEMAVGVVMVVLAVIALTKAFESIGGPVLPLP